VAKERSPFISFYILTDGEYGEEPPVFAGPIRDLLGKAREMQSVKASFFSVTIIQFGDGPNGGRQLALLRQSVFNLDNLPPAL
jgi:hypothetical protein